MNEPESSAETPAGNTPGVSPPEAASADSGPQVSESPRRRIPIGTQRPGVKVPAVGSAYRYVVEKVEATASAAPAAGEVEPPAALESPVHEPVERGPPQEHVPPQEHGPPQEHRALPPAGGAGGAGRGKGRRGGPKPVARLSPADVLPPAKRVSVPNLRHALDDELEADFEAALGGLEIDTLLDAAASGRVEAPLEPGTRMTGRVLSIGGDTAFLDLGGRRQGALKLTGWLDSEDALPAVGQEIDVTVGGRNEEDSLYDVAPANRAVAVEDWSQLQAGMVVAARVVAANKGGLECDVSGLRGFMPASLVSTWRIENLEELVGQTLDSLVTELVPEARRLVLSRRAVIERQAADARAKLLETLEPGVELDGTVRSVRDFGAFVDIGDGVEGLVHVSELSWDRVASATEVLQAGQKVRVVVKKVDRQTGKIGLSAKELIESPWKRAADRYHVGATVRGTVSRIAQFGAFVKLEPGVEGLVHVSELATRHIRSVGDVVREGEAVECRVLSVDPDAQRLSLSIKALAPPPAMTSSAAEPAAEEDDEPAVPPPPPKKRKTPLKGGLG